MSFAENRMDINTHTAFLPRVLRFYGGEITVNPQKACGG